MKFPATLLCLASILFLAGSAMAQAPGAQSFQALCASCHGTDGNGGEHAPSMLARLRQMPGPAEIRTFLHDGIPARGMPAFANIAEPELTTLVTYLRTLAMPPAAGRGGAGRGGPQARFKAVMADGSSLEGVAIGQTGREVQLRTDDQHVHLLRKAGEKFREVTSQSDWPNMHGQVSGNRYAPAVPAAKMITKANVTSVAPKWVYAVPNAGRMQATPQVVGGIMYIPTTNTVTAVDAGSGARIWSTARPQTTGLVGNARGLGNNRSVSIAGDRVFMQTDNAHLVALNRFTGAVIWDIEMADYRQNYNATGGLLAVENLVIAGTAGGEEGVRGFLAAYEQDTGKELWRFWTIPAKGEKGSETWEGDGILHGGGPTWLTGSYDPATKTIYWPTGNAGPDFNGDNRKGDNLYTCSILALDLTTGKLKWYFQATPHDEWDWDAVQPLVLVDANWHGQPRKLLLQANRNGFLYILDRTDGKMLLAQPLVKKLTWARGIAPDGRPIMNPNQTPTTEGTTICPSVDGATNFYSTSYSPITGYFYVNTLERCNIFTKRTLTDWVAGRGFAGGGARRVPDEKSQKILRAFDIQTGKPVWELPQDGQGDSWTGTVTTAAGLVFFGDDGGALSAADATTGKKLWSFPFPDTLHTSPMTYVFDNRQYVAIAVGGQIYSFGLPE